MEEVDICTAELVKGKGHPRIGHEGPEGECRYSSTLSLISALDGGGGQRHAPAALPREWPGTHCIGGWVGPRAGLEGCRKTSGFDPRTVQPVASCNTNYNTPAHNRICMLP